MFHDCVDMISGFTYDVRADGQAGADACPDDSELAPLSPLES